MVMVWMTFLPSPLFLNHQLYFSLVVVCLALAGTDGSVRKRNTVNNIVTLGVPLSSNRRRRFLLGLTISWLSALALWFCYIICPNILIATTTQFLCFKAKGLGIRWSSWVSAHQGHMCRNPHSFFCGFPHSKKQPFWKTA